MSPGVSPATDQGVPVTALLYAGHTYNNPVKYTDPTGHKPLCLDDQCFDTNDGAPSLSYTPAIQEVSIWIDRELEKLGLRDQDFSPNSGPDWLPDFVQEDYLLAQNAVWIVGHPDATGRHRLVAGSVLLGYGVGYGGLVVGTGALGYAGIEYAVASSSSLIGLRQGYEAAVNGIAQQVERWKAAGLSTEQIARNAVALRRNIGLVYKEATPWLIRQSIYLRNTLKYNDKLGPTFEYFLNQNKPLERIISGASNPGGGPIIRTIMSLFGQGQ